MRSAKSVWAYIIMNGLKRGVYTMIVVVMMLCIWLRLGQNIEYGGTTIDFAHKDINFNVLLVKRGQSS
jgi:hypothetical protein